MWKSNKIGGFSVFVDQMKGEKMSTKFNFVRYFYCFSMSYKRVCNIFFKKSLLNQKNKNTFAPL